MKNNVKRAAVWITMLLVLATMLPSTVFAAEHVHEWSYARNSRTSITAYCANTDGACTSQTVNITVSAPADTAYNGSAKNVSISGALADMNYTETYFKGNTILTSAPTEVGEYSAEVMFGNATASIDFEITPAEVTAVTLDVAAPVAGKAPSATLADGTGYTAAIAWSPADTTFKYNTEYTATVTLTAKDGYTFADSLSAGDGWIKSTVGGKPVFTKKYPATEKEQITDVIAPTVANGQFTGRYESGIDAIAALPASATVTVNGRPEALTITWSCASYSTADSIENTFIWSIDEAIAAKSYTVADGTVTSGSLKVKNADKPIALSHSGTAFVDFGKTWADVSFNEVKVMTTEGDEQTVSGTWIFDGKTLTDRPTEEGTYAATFIPDDPIYETHKCSIKLEFHLVNPKVSVLLDKDVDDYYPTETVSVSISAVNPNIADWTISTELFKVTYQIGDGEVLPLTGDSFALPDEAEGKIVTLVVELAETDTGDLHYSKYTYTQYIAVNTRLDVNNIANNSTIPYTNTYDVTNLFTPDPNAGTATYRLIGDNTIAKLNGTTLTISGTGKIEIELHTAVNGKYAEDTVTAVLTVEKAPGSGTVSMSGWIYGETANLPTPISSTNGTVGVIYTYEGVDPTLYPASSTPPTNAGNYKVTATFPENNRYKSCTASAAFSIGKATPSLGTVSCTTTLYDTTLPSLVNLTPSDTSVPGTIKLIGVSELTVGTNEYTYEFTPNDTDNYIVLSHETVTLTVIKDEAKALTVGGSLANTTYTHGDTLDPTGLTLTVEYSSGLTDDVSLNDEDITLPTLTAGQTSATISYQDIQATIPTGITVAKAQLNVSGMSWSVGNYTYNGKTQGPTLVGTLPTGVVATPSGNTETVAGTYTATVTFSLDSNHPARYYEIVGTVADCIWSIAKAKATVNGVSAANATYDQTAKSGFTGTPTGDYSGEYTVTYTGRGNTTYAASADAPVDAGEYTVTIAIPDSDNCYTGSTSLDFTIAKATVTVTADDQSAYVAHTIPTLTATVTGLYGTDTLLVEPTMTTDANINVAGTYTITASGADAGSNYTVTYVDGTITVTRAQGSGSVTIEGWTYGQDANAPVPSSDTNGTDGVTYLYEGTANDGTAYSSAQAPTLAGSYTVTATFPETTLYAQYVSEKVPFTIAKATPVYTTPSTLYASYGDTLSELTLPTGFHWSISESTTVGSAGMSYFNASYVPDDTNNYLVVFNIAVPVSVSALSVNNAVIVVGSTLVYNGKEQTRDFIITKVNGQTVTYTISGNTATEVGDYTLTITGTGNFTGSLSMDWSIAPCDISGAVVTLGDALTYTGAAQTQTVSSVKIDGLNATYTVTSGNSATDVGIYYLTIEGNGNFKGTKSVRWTIAPDTTKIDPLTPENVTSADREDILEVLDSIRTEEAKREWDDVIDKCEELLDAIENSARTIDDVLAALDKYDIDTVKSTDQLPIERLEKEIDYLLKQENLTDAERSALEGGADKADALLERIDEVAEKMADILDRLAGYDIETVKSTDKADIEDIVADIRALLDGQNLTPDEREDMQEAKTYAGELLDRIADAYDQAHTDNAQRAAEITEQNVTVDDRTLLENAINDLQSAIALYPGNYTTDERAAIDDELERLGALLEILDKIDAVQDKIDNLPEDAQPGDQSAQDAYDDAKEDYDALTDHEKSQIDTDKLDDLAGKLVDYQIIEGKDGHWIDTSADGLGFVANGPLSKFTEILVDDVVVSSSSYTAVAPTTTLTLSADYLSTLEAGKHTLTVRYSDGEASCEFSTEKTAVETPDEEGTGSWIWILVIILIILFIVGGAIIFFLIYKKKEDSAPSDTIE